MFPLDNDCKPMLQGPSWFKANIDVTGDLNWNAIENWWDDISNVVPDAEPINAEEKLECSLIFFCE